MDSSVLGTVDDSFDPNIFSCIDVGNPAGSSGDQVDFNWVDEFITSTETCEPADSEGPSSGQDASTAISIQQAAPVQRQQQQQQQPQQQQQQLLQNVLQQQQQPQAPQQQTPSVGKVIMAMGQSSQQQSLAVAASDSSTATQQLLSTNQTQLLHSSVGGQSMTQPFILKASNPIQLVTSSVSQSTAGMGGAPQQFVPAASGLSSISASQSSSPMLNRSMTPNLTSTTTHTTSQLPAINLLHVQQPQQLTQTLPLSNFVANQQNLQGHAVLTAQGSNIVHTQNALIQNPNVVNVNVAHVLPNHQLPQLQVLQTPQGKIYVQSPAGNQALPQQLCLGQVAGAQSVQMAGSQAVQMASQPVQLASAQTMQVASNVGLAQPAATVIAQPQSNVALGNNSGVGQQQASLNFINIGGSQGQIVLGRMPSASTVTQAQALAQGPIFLRTINGQQQLIPQPTLQSTPSTTQLPQPQQLVTQQAGTTQNIPLQQLLTGVGGSPLRLVGPTAVSTSQVSSLSSTSTSTTPSIVLQPFVTTNQVPLLGHQVSTQAGSKSGTVTLNLGGQNLNLHQFQNLSALQLSSSQPQSIIVQQQQQQQQVTVQHTVVQTPSVKVSAGSSSKKSKSKNTVTSSTASSSASSSVPAMSADNILSAALMSSGILDDEELQSLMNGSDMSDSTLLPSEVAITPSPSSVCTTQTPTPPPPPTPPTTVTKKSKKKKKEVGGNMLQHVVLSSTAMKSAITITTASATTVTTTLSQSALSAQTLSVSTSSLISTPLVSLSANSSILSNISQLAATTTSVPTLRTLPTASLPVPVSSTSSTSSGRGKQGPPNVTVKGLGSLQGLSDQDMQELLSIQASISKLKDQPSLDQSSLALMQQLDMKRRKILAAYSNTQGVKLQQQQQQQQQGQQAEQRMGAGTMQIRLQGQSVTTHIPPDTSSQQTVATQASSIQAKMAQAIVPLQSLGAQGQTTLQLAAQPATVHLDVKPVVGTPSNPVLQIQPKSNSKLTLVSPKAEPATSQTRVGDSAVDIKPVLGVGGLDIAHTSSASSQGSTFPTGTGKVIMAMANPPTPGQAASNQPNVLRIQIGGHTAQATTFPKASTTPVTTTTHQTILPSTHKMGISSSAVTTVTTSVTSSPAVSHMPAVNVSPNQARPVQIKIANQVLTVQLTQQQQEKLELHLSRMTLEQQQAFLRQQQHILAKLQHRVDSHSTSQASTTQNSAVSAGNEQPSTSAAATVKAPASASVDTTPAPVQQGVQVMNATSSLTTTPAQQLPATVQALVGSQPKTESGKQGTGTSSTSTTSALRCLNMDIPKSSMIHSQLSRDQEHATSPDTKTPFKDHREACRRLLRYHVHQSHEPIEQFSEFDENFNDYCEDLIARKDGMLAKFRLLLLQDCQQKYLTAEQVQISRMWCTEMTNLEREERELVKNDPDAFIPMPLSYLEKDLTKAEEESSEEEEEEEESRPPSEEEEEEEDRHEESEEEVQQAAESPIQETASGKEDMEAREPSPQDYFHSSPYHSYGAGDPGSPRPEAEEDTAGWEQPHEDRDPEWEDESIDKEPVGDVSSEIEPDQLNSSFNDFFEASTPVQEEHDLTHSSPLQDSSYVAEEQCSFQSESSRSSPPRAEPPTRTVRLVIRADKTGVYTSKLLEKRRSSDAGERRSLRKRSHSGHEREVKKEPVTEEVEYIDVDNSKYSKGVSVKLERLSERTSRVYGLNITGKAASSVAGGAQKTSADMAGSSMTSASSCGSKSGGKSGRKRRGGEVMSSGSSRKMKKNSDFSGVKTSDCDKPSDSVFREVEEESGFYVGSAMESLDHFDSEDEEDRGRHYGGGRMGQSVIDVKREVPAHSASSRHPSARNSVSSLAESGSKGLGQSRRSFEDLAHAGSMDSQEAEPHMFAHPRSESLPHGHRRSEKNSRRTLDTSFDLDSADPQRSMVNPQVQSAIDSILNCSGSSDLYDGGAAATEMAHVRPRYEVGGSSTSNSRHGASSHRWDQERSHNNDLNTDVHSILR